VTAELFPLTLTVGRTPRHPRTVTLKLLRGRADEVQDRMRRPTIKLVTLTLIVTAALLPVTVGVAFATTTRSVYATKLVAACRKVPPFPRACATAKTLKRLEAAVPAVEREYKALVVFKKTRLPAPPASKRRSARALRKHFALFVKDLRMQISDVRRGRIADAQQIGDAVGLLSPKLRSEFRAVGAAVCW
jgi:hypothetical protein